MDINSLKYHLRLCQDKNGLNIVQKRKGLRVTKERWGKVFLCLDILPAEIGRAARRTVESWRLATKGGETCEKFRQMKMPSVGVFFFFFLSDSHPPTSLLGMSTEAQTRGAASE